MDRRRVIDWLFGVASAVAISSFVKRNSVEEREGGRTVVTVADDVVHKSSTEHLRWGWVRENAVWILGLLPFVAAIIRLYMFSGGDQAVLVAVLTDINITALVLSGIVSILPFIILVFACYFGLHFLRKDQIAPAVILYLVLAISSVILTPISQIMGFSVCVIVLPAIIIVVLYLTRKDGFEFPAEILLASVALTAIITTSIPYPVGWLKTELIQVGSSPPRAASVVDEQDDALTLVWADAGVERVLVDDVVTRVVCSPNVESRLVLDALMRRPDRERTVICDVDRADGFDWYESPFQWW